MSADVTAVMLSIGEPYAERALASVQRQTLMPAEILRIGGDVQPFHRAINAAAERVRTPFFLQVDADMVLNAWCLEELRAAIDGRAGVALGSLWDPMMGAEAGIKLFATECIRRTPFLDTVSPDTDFLERSARAGWSVAYRLPSRPSADAETPWPTFGRHDPDYRPAYAFARFRLIGTRYRRQRALTAFRWRYARLGASSHPRALLSRVALLLGVFGDQSRDSLAPDLYRVDEGALWLERFLGSGELESARGAATLVAREPDRDTFLRSLEIGARCRSAGDAAGFRSWLAGFDRHDEPAMWYARAGLCHGLYFGADSVDRVREAHDAVRNLVVGGT